MTKKTIKEPPKMKEPKDLGVKIGTKHQAFLENVKKSMEQEIESCKNTILLDEALLVTLNKLISAEKAKLK